MKVLMSKKLKTFVEAFESQRKFCQEYDIDPATLSKYLKDELGCAASFIAKIKEKTHMDFEKAFVIEPDEIPNRRSDDK